MQRNFKNKNKGSSQGLLINKGIVLCSLAGLPSSTAEPVVDCEKVEHQRCTAVSQLKNSRSGIK